MRRVLRPTVFVRRGFWKTKKLVIKNCLRLHLYRNSLWHLTRSYLQCSKWNCDREVSHFTTTLVWIIWEETKDSKIKSIVLNFSCTVEQCYTNQFKKPVLTMPTDRLEEIEPDKLKSSLKIMLFSGKNFTYSSLNLLHCYLQLQVVSWLQEWYGEENEIRVTYLLVLWWNQLLKHLPRQIYR